ncbi:MAG: hypothetical protein HQK55_02975 [Deltaproteobacteria bacterium]|nr:hypothetical protein [Deltaproteobacteria bacterium]
MTEENRVKNVNEPPSGPIKAEKSDVLNRVRAVMDRLENDLRTRKETTEVVLKESQAKQDQILNYLDNRLRTLEVERIQSQNEIKTLQTQLGTAVRKNLELEKQAAITSTELDSLKKDFEMVMKEKTGLDLRTRELEQAKATLGAALAGAEAQLTKDKEEFSRKTKALETEFLKARETAEIYQQKISSLENELTRAVGLAESVIEEKAKIELKLKQLQNQWEHYMKG